MAKEDAKFITETTAKISLKKENKEVTMQEASRTRITQYRNGERIHLVNAREMTNCQVKGIYYDVVMAIYFDKKHKGMFENNVLQNIPKPKSVDHIVFKDGKIIGIEFKYIDWDSEKVKRNSSLARKHMAMKIIASWFTLHLLGIEVDAFEIVTCHKEGFSEILLNAAIDRVIEKNALNLSSHEKTLFKNIHINVLSLSEFHEESNISKYSDLVVEKYNALIKNKKGEV